MWVKTVVTRRLLFYLFHIEVKTLKTKQCTLKTIKTSQIVHLTSYDYLVKFDYCKDTMGMSSTV